MVLPRRDDSAEQPDTGGWFSLPPATPRVTLEPVAPPAAPVTKPATPRALSLDAMRGLTIVLMLLVNNMALDTATPRQFLHAPWNGGVRLADLVFPWFLLCVGIAISFAAASFRRKALPVWRHDLKIVYRSAALVLLGCLIDSAIQHRPTFALGVLQTIGLAYLIGALLYDLPGSRRLLVAAGMLFAYWAAIKYLPIPGVGAGVLTADRNFIWYLNRTYFGPVHLWGLPSVVPTAALVMIGSLIGDLLQRKVSHDLWRVVGMFIGGLALIVGGLWWNSSLPFSKALWTPSYILFTAGLGTILLALLYLVIDIVGWRRWIFPLLIFGSNAIVAYVVPILIKVWVLQSWHVGVGAGASLPVDQYLLHSAVLHLGRIAGGWCYTLGYVAAWWLVLWQLYRHKLFLRV